MSTKHWKFLLRVRWYLSPNFFFLPARRACHLRSSLLLFLMPLLFACQQMSGLQPEKSGVAWVYAVGGEFEEVRDNLVETIEAEGMVISYVSHAQAMLSRTAITLGVEKNTYGDAEVLLFCQAAKAHYLTAENPHNLILCPYSAAVYTLAGEGDRVYLAIRKPEPDVPEYDDIHQMLHNLILAVVDQ